MAPRARSGFTLIELLTVIAIIAVIAAIAFPVFSRVRENARQTTCISNMHELYVKANLYRQDYDAYPPLLLGYAERADGQPWQAGDATPPVPANRIQMGLLYPRFVKSIETFRCPDNAVSDLTAVASASFPTNAGWTGPATYQSHGLPFQPADTPIPYYKADSYDISASLADPTSFVVVYARDWTAAQAQGADTRQDKPNQMKFPEPPLDRTILTWCNYHVTTAGGTRCPVILLSGTARTMDAKQVAQQSWNAGGQ